MFASVQIYRKKIYNIFDIFAHKLYTNVKILIYSKSCLLDSTGISPPSRLPLDQIQAYEKI